MAVARVLVVDDEPVVLDLVSRMLSMGGYEVLNASGPNQALEIVRADGSIDLVLSDVVMPGMNGPELLREIARISPGTSGLVMSGYAADVPRDIPLLNKPFTLENVLFTVELALAKAGQRRHELEATDSPAATRRGSAGLRKRNGPK